MAQPSRGWHGTSWHLAPARPTPSGAASRGCSAGSGVTISTRSRLAAAYAVLGLVVAPFLYFVVPRITFSLHPDSVINTRGKIEVESRMLQVLLMGSVGFNIVFFWMHNLQSRLATVAVRREGARERLAEREA